MTDANGFYRPSGLPEDVPDDDDGAKKRCDDDDDNRPLHDDESDLGTETDMSLLTGELSRPPSSQASYLRYESLARRPQMSMMGRDYTSVESMYGGEGSVFSDSQHPTDGGPYIQRSYTPSSATLVGSSIYTPTAASQYTPSVPGTQYTPSATGTRYTPSEAGTQYTASVPQYTSYSSEYVGSAAHSRYTPPEPQYPMGNPPMEERGHHGFFNFPRQYGTAPSAPLPMHIETENESQKKRRCNRRFLRIVLRAALLIVLATLLLRATASHYNWEFDHEKLPLPGRCRKEHAYASHGSHHLSVGSTFSFVEDADMPVTGKLFVRSATDDTHEVRVDYDIISTRPDAVKFSLDGETDIVTMHSSEKFPRPKPCVATCITITIPQSLTTLFLNTRTLPIELSSTLSLTTLKLATKTAHVHAHSGFTTRNRTSISLQTGGISGVYPLGESLHLETAAGDITATIRPLNITAAAVLTAKSTSGSINLGLYNTYSVPARNYSTITSTKAGAISGLYLLSSGGSTVLETIAGGVDANILPVPLLGEEKAARLETHSKDGATRLRFKEDLGGVRVAGKHEALTGRVDIGYPGDWEGSISAEAKVGNVEVSGSGVEIVRRDWGVVEARKGDDGRGSITAVSEVGGINVHIG